MHIQIRTKPTASAADLEKLLRVLATAKVNLKGAGGGDLELDGEFAFTVEDDQLEAAREALRGAKYAFDEVEPYVCWMDDRPGELRRCVAEASRENLATGKVIKDIAIGPPRTGDGRVPVQIYSIEVRTQLNTVEPPPPDADLGGDAATA